MKLSDIRNITKICDGASSWEEVRIYIDMNGYDIWDVDILRRIRTHVSRKDFYLEFVKDVENNIEKIYTFTEIENMVKNVIQSTFNHTYIRDPNPFEKMVYELLFKKYDIKIIKRCK